MDKTVAVKWMQGFDQRVEAEKDHLSELDGPIGDGDHGANLARGMAAAIEAINTTEPQSAAEVFKAVSMALISKVGGASGPLYGTAFLEMAKASAKTDDLAELMELALAGIKKRGGAEAGDKTMVDVWTVLVPKLKDNSLTQADIDAAVESTKDMVAKKGRASYLGERSVGHLDPGAVSSGYLFTALLEAGVM